MLCTSGFEDNVTFQFHMIGPMRVMCILKRQRDDGVNVPVQTTASIPIKYS